MGCGNNNCSDCDGNYPEIASAFTRVPNNFNSVNNSIDKFTIYKTLSVVEKAVEHVACTDRTCAETGKSGPFNHYVDDDSDMGFLHFPLRIRTDFAQVCGKLQCAKDGYRGGSGCDSGDIDCDDALLGFISHPRHEVAQDIRACNAIKSDIACSDGGNRGPETARRCKVLLDCQKSRSSSASSLVAARKLHRKKKRGCGCH